MIALKQTLRPAEEPMRRWHIEEDLFRRFLDLETTREQTRQIVRHLLAGCEPCSELAARISSEAGWQEAYEKFFDRTLSFAHGKERRLAEEKLHGWAQWAFLETLPSQQRVERVQKDATFHNWGLYHRLLDASRWYLYRDPAEAVDICHLAVLVAQRLSPSILGKKRIADLQAAASATLGNTKRVAGDFKGARRAFNEAWRILEEHGTNQPGERATILSLEASYMKDIGEFETAEAALEEALELYRTVGDPHLQGRLLLKMGEAIGHVSPDKGISHIKKALALIDAHKDPRLDLCAQHTLAWFLTDLGRLGEALSVLDRARSLYQRFPDDLTQLRLHWLEAKIAHRRGDLGEAEAIFQQIWEEFRVRDLNQEVVLISIELAEVLTKKGEAARAADLAAGCYSIMRSWGLHKDALAAWIVFQNALGAVSESQALGDLFGRIQEYFRRHWVRPAAFEG
jgi:tetratricopeptide (TPR) repeat protein